MKNKTRPIWMPLFIEKFLADTRGLTLSQTGAYINLLSAMWRSGDGTLSNNDKDLARSAGAERKHWWQIWPAIESLFDVDGDRVTSTHLQSELGRANARIVMKRAAGSLGGQTTQFKRGLSRDPLPTPKPLKSNDWAQACAQANYNYNIEKKEERSGSPRPETGSPSLKEKEAPSGEGATDLSAKPSSPNSPQASALEKALQNWGENFRRRHGGSE
jgi:uncharacterized protein YdaU (DUF1376 family)